MLTLHNAVLCVDCESVNNNRFDKCPVCGSASVLSMEKVLGGSLLARYLNGSTANQSVLFDLEITIGVQQMDARELNAAVDGITRLIAPKLGRGRARLHINVQPVPGSGSAYSGKAA